MNPKSFYPRLLSLVLTIFVLFVFCGNVHADESFQRDIVLKRVGHELYSPIVELDKPYNTVVLNLGDFADGLKVNFHPDQGRSWEPVVTHDDGYGSSFLLFSSPSRFIQFLKEPKGDETSFSLKADFLYEGVPSDSDQNWVSGPETSAGFRVIPRSEWGADETMRYWSPDLEEMYQGSDTEADSGNVDPCGNFATQYKDEVGIDRTVSTSPAGDVLVWPLAYSKSIKKIVVHHTDSDIRDLNGDLRTDGQDYKAMMRAIYRFHTFTRGWGDIGYNYVIDPLGNVYEGRYGGDRVVGAHAQCFNNGSLGIAIIGDYQAKKVPEPALNSLINLIALKSRQFGIEPQATSSFRGKDLFNVLGHRDVRPTSCPGDVLYSLLPKIRDRAGFAIRSGTFSESSVPVQSMDYNAEPQSAVDTLSLLPNERKIVTLRFKNIGTKTWDSNTWLHVALNDRESARVVSLIPDKSFVAADMKENSVGPGETGTFEVDFEAGYFGANVAFELAPVINGRYKVSRAAVFIPVQVAAPVFDYAVAKTSLPKGVIFQGQKILASVELKNTGNVAWVNYGTRAIKLGTEEARDRKSLLAKKSPTRLGYLVQSEVKPGETGTFALDLEAPLKFEGEIREHFTPVIERVGWLPNKDLGFNVIVKKPIHMARIAEKTKVPTLIPGEMKKIQVTLENRGDLPWESDTMAIGLLAKELKIFKTEMVPSSPVYPKSTSNFDFWVQAPYKEVDGSVFLNSKFRKIAIRGGTARFLIHVPAPRLRAQKVSQSSAQVDLRPGEERGLEVQFKNLSNAVWRNSGPNTVYLGTTMPQDRASALYYQGSWENKSRAGKLVEKEVYPGQTATFLFKVKPQTRGDYRETFQLVMERIGWIDGGLVRWDFHVSGDKVTGAVDFKKDSRDNKANAATIAKAKPVTSSVSGVAPVAKTNDSTPVVSTPFRVRISYASDQPNVTADRNFQVIGKGDSILFDVKAGSPVEIRHVNDLFHVQVGTNVKSSSLIRIVPLEGGIVEILSMERRPEWNKGLNDNKFRGILEIREVNGATAFINELPLEDYVSGLAEVSNDTPFEKQKAIAILARTYARYYMENAHRKFPGLPYDGSDDPAVFQRYLGYGVELRSPNFVSAVLATRDRVVTYNGKLIKTPYFNQSNGKTLSALEVWGWKDTPYLQSVADPYCEGLVRKGHGVGLSGCGAEGMAKAGKRYDEIIKYYFQGVEIEKVKF
jgi:hypothetical protein